MYSGGAPFWGRAPAVRTKRANVPEQVNDLAEAKATLVAKQQMLKAAEAAVEQSKRGLETAQRQLERYQAQGALEESTLKRQEELFANKAATNQQLGTTL